MLDRGPARRGRHAAPSRRRVAQQAARAAPGRPGRSEPRRAPARRRDRRPLPLVSGSRRRFAARLKAADPVLEAMGHAMEQELERIFRLMALLFPDVGGLHDAYVGVALLERPSCAPTPSSSSTTCSSPSCARLMVPLLDGQVTTDERIELAERSGRCAARDRRTGGRPRCWPARMRGCDRARCTRSARCSYGLWRANCIGSKPVRTRCCKRTCKAARRRLAGEPWRQAAELPATRPLRTWTPGVGAG